MDWSHVDYLWIKVVAHWVRNCRPKFTLINKYDLTLLCQSCLHNASETFVCHETIGMGFEILRFRMRSMHFDSKKLKNGCKHFGLSVQWSLLSCFYQLFGHWFRRHPFTAEHPLVSKWCNTEIFQMCSDKERKYSTSWMTWGLVHFQQFYYF